MKTKLLLALPLLAYHDGGKVHIDDQAANGLRLWLLEFDSVILACRTRPGKPPEAFLVIDDPRIEFAPLPESYSPHGFALEIFRRWASIRAMIEDATHLHCAIGGLIGDWPSIFAVAAHLEGRPFAVWTDRVESQVARSQAKERRGLRRLYRLIAAKALAVYERQIIRRSAIGLFHGMDCFEAYAPSCPNPHLVHNVHLGREDVIGLEELARRLSRHGPLRVAYAGRAHKDKGVFDWIEALRLVPDVDATWFGDGPDLESARLTAPDNVRFHGVVEHKELIRRLKGFDAFVFCHKTRESPRCLIEALICGLPIIGYDSAYPRDLIKEHGGGILAPLTPQDLALAIERFRKDRRRLSERARLDGMLFDAESIFRHRSQLMKSIHVS